MSAPSFHKLPQQELAMLVCNGRQCLERQVMLKRHTQVVVQPLVVLSTAIFRRLLRAEFVDDCVERHGFVGCERWLWYFTF
ncbi:hypothetical protein PanWU01x14_064390 [Parasponia andersonii]|uniref:Uncharacterized protein n=1 Tax=Parasponia andersonii TaxID=3476 RepID=A0A2P5DHD4_PARAD|nr:hypothetical protein PanWU01x14_064390 [Parasponia andersonii]